MEIKPITWLIGDAAERSFVSDLREGRAGALVRGLLSVGAAALALTPGMFVLGLIETTGGRADDHHVGMAIASAAVLWGVALLFLWWGYRRFRHLIRATIGILIIWAAVVPSAVAIESALSRADFLIASLILAAVAFTFGLVAAGASRMRIGRRVVDRRGEIVVCCPTCKYSLVGLRSTTCPECGERFTVDQIILAQGYASVTALTEGEPIDVVAPPALASDVEAEREPEPELIRGA